MVQLKMVLIKCCDISNEVRPMEVAEPWVDCLLEEYFMQVGPTEWADVLKQNRDTCFLPESSSMREGGIWESKYLTLDIKVQPNQSTILFCYSVIQGISSASWN